MQQLYTTPEASKETGIPEGTIRSWLSRHKSVFQVGVHIIIEETGRKMWTSAGLDVLLRRKSAGENAANDVANFDADDLLEALQDQDSQQLARAYYQLLPIRTLERLYANALQPNTRRQRNCYAGRKKCP